MSETTPVVREEEMPKVEIQATSFFGNKDLFEHVQRVAKMFSQSELVPKRYQGNVGNCVIALEMSQRIGASPLMVMQHLYVVNGTPGWSSVFLIATLNASGRFSPLRYEEDEKEGGRTRAWAIEKATGEKLYGAWASMNMAKAEGWIDKNGSKWKTMPELMRRYRAASFFTKQFAPEVSMGLQTVEEVYDISPPTAKEITKEMLTTLLEEKKENFKPSEYERMKAILDTEEVASYQKVYEKVK